MTRTFAYCSSAIISLGLSASVAWADVTADEIWSNWKDMVTSYGMTLSAGSEDRAGGTLTVSGLNMSLTGPEGQMFNSMIDEVVFAERGDGTVEITVSPTYSVAFEVTGDDGENVSGKASISQSGLTMIASRDGDTTSYNYLAASLRVGMDELTVDGEAMPFALEMTMAGIKGTSNLTEGVPRRVSGDLDAEALDVTIDVSDPEGSGRFQMTAAMTGIESRSDGTIASLAAFDDLAALLKSGFSTESEFSHSGAEYSVRFSEDAETFNLDSSSQGGGLHIALGEQGMSYGTRSEGIEIAASGSEIPFPQVEVAMGEYAGEVTLPLLKSDEPQDFGFLFKLVDLQVSDMIWGMFDPAGMLPHDPATLIVDIDGKANWLIEITDPEVAEAAGDEIPAALHSLDVTELKLAAVGAEVTGEGGFTFNNDDLQTFDGLPAPSGAIDVKMVGINGLLDRLTQMGLLPEEQAMGARMMLGLFARPGPGEDTLTSRIEITEDGQVVANGQRLR